MAGDFSIQVDDSSLRRFIPTFLRKRDLIPASLRQSTEERADLILTDLRDHTPYDPEHTGEEPHARDGWELEQRGADLAIVNPVDHLYFLLHGNHANDPDGRIHAKEAGVLHFEAGGSDVFTQSVKPMEASPEMVEAVARAEHSAASFGHQVADGLRHLFA